MTGLDREQLRRQALVYFLPLPRSLTELNEEIPRRRSLLSLVRRLGFSSVSLVHDSLVDPGASCADHPGFRRMLAAVQSGGVGAVFCLDAQRLTFTARHWCSFIEHQTLLIDLENAGDLRHLLRRPCACDRSSAAWRFSWSTHASRG